MPKFLPAIAAGVVAVALAFSPAISASAAPTHAVKHYTLSVTGNGKHASVVYTTLTVSKSGTATKPTVHTIAKAHEPWSKHVAAKADLYEIVAVQTTGSKLTCTIKNTKGHVIARSTSTGKNTIVTCIVAKNSLLAGIPAGGSGSSTGGGTTSGS